MEPTMSKSAVRAVRTEPAPSIEMDTAPRRQWLTEAEVERIIRHAASERDRLMVLVAYRHGLRVSELIGLTWRQVDFDAARLRVIRAKGSEDGVHPLSGREIRALRALRRHQAVGTRWVFVTSRAGPMTRNGFFKLLVKAATRAGIPDVHPHALRHGCGFKLVNQGMDTLSLAAYLGHANVQNTKRYARMDAARFDGLWRD
jgi:type 1 fimbriae regulatory protein FimB/type 1 fimbriae regulatory protein FimE